MPQNHVPYNSLQTFMFELLYRVWRYGKGAVQQSDVISTELICYESGIPDTIGSSAVVTYMKLFLT